MYDHYKFESDLSIKPESEPDLLHFNTFPSGKQKITNTYENKTIHDKNMDTKVFDGVLNGLELKSNSSEEFTKSFDFYRPIAKFIAVEAPKTGDITAQDAATAAEIVNRLMPEPQALRLIGNTALLCLNFSAQIRLIGELSSTYTALISPTNNFDSSIFGRNALAGANKRVLVFEADGAVDLANSPADKALDETLAYLSQRPAGPETSV